MAATIKLRIGAAGLAEGKVQYRIMIHVQKLYVFWMSRGFAIPGDFFVSEHRELSRPKPFHQLQSVSKMRSARNRTTSVANPGFQPRDPIFSDREIRRMQHLRFEE